jgi:hypothetical protein
MPGFFLAGGTTDLYHVKSVAVEESLDSIKRAKGTRAKIRNILSAIFHHAMRVFPSFRLKGKKPI